MNPNDQQFERFLREFQPPHRLPLLASPPIPKNTSRRFAAAAIVLLAGTLSLWWSTRPSNELSGLPVATRADSLKARSGKKKRMSTMHLIRVYWSDPELFEDELDAEARLSLPSVRGAQSTLAVLAKE